MSRLMIAITGAGPLFAIPAFVMTLREFLMRLSDFTAVGWWPDLASSGVACAALLVLNAALAPPAAPGGARPVVANVILTPVAAWFCYVGAVDAVALVLALPLVAVVALLLPRVRPVRGFAVSR
ncbi:hypothetical protein [Sphingomonas sp. Leaf231]|uniref:hypothetical protein n=1 Tax=Sphingomonas sp. Leaf231 TaxID=1736301 RepID=UPI0012E2B0A8|nr:hypothetical protein [Sphingomonas sp. Leaf231]